MDWILPMLTIIDFLLIVENYDYLFKDIVKRFDKYCLQDLFLKNLEPFIVKNRIKRINKNYVKTII